MRVFRKTLFIMITSAAAQAALASDLMNVYQDALAQDPTYAQARATWLSAKEAAPIAMANLLPSLDLQGTASYTHNDTDVNSTSRAHGYALSATQTIFNYADWKAAAGAEATVKAAAATYSYAAQDLIYRVAQAYFSVLKAKANLRYTQADKQAVLEQLHTAQQKHKAGVVNKTAVLEAQSSYDEQVAQEIGEKHALEDAIEDLRAITNKSYPRFARLRRQAPLVPPTPRDINAWVKKAENNNYSMLAQKYTVEAAKEAIAQNASGRYPTLTASGSISRSTTTSSGVRDTVDSNVAKLTLDVPIYHGGSISANTDKARADYLGAVSTMEYTRRALVNTARQSYLGVLSGISKVRADKVAIDSAKEALKNTEASYIVGLRTMFDVLSAVSKLYKADKAYAVDQLDLILETLKLKQTAGTLSSDDLKRVDQWLSGANKTSVVSAKAKPNTGVSKGSAYDHYEIQIAALSDLKAIQGLYNEIKQKPKLMYTQAGYTSVKIHGQTLYRLRLGWFKTKAGAKKALATLPASWRQYGPWIVHQPA